jgi:hypothetical protein
MGTEQREFVRERAADKCEYCRLPQSSQLLPFHVEHIIAKQHGGGDSSGQIAPLFHPRRDKWMEHFAVRKDGRIDGLTASGRATIQLLQFNASRRVEVRRELLQAGLLD